MSFHLDDELLSGQVDGALDASEAATVSAHLATCDDCAHRLELLGATRRAVATLPGEDPGRLDLAFLSRSPVVNLPAPSRGFRSPRWAAPVLAAAAVVVAIVGVGNLALHRGGGAAGTTALAPSLRAPGAQGGPVADENGANNSAAGPVPAGTGPAAGSAVTRQQSQPFAAPAFGGTAVTSTFEAAGGATLTLAPATTRTTVGSSVRLSITARAGNTGLDVRSLGVVVRRGRESVDLFGGGSETIPPSRASTLYGDWVAGNLGAAGGGPGSYVVEAHLVLADGRDLVVSVDIQVD